MMGIARLIGTVKHYDWGGTTYIPWLLQADNKAGRPFAEYWMGVHPLANCTVEPVNAKSQPLREIIDSDRQSMLGSAVYNRFGDLPYLLKVLDVKDMLSIQVHPSKQSAIEEFEAENKKNIPLDSPVRNYKDNNHKPELLVALGDFWLLHGFKSPDRLMETLGRHKELAVLQGVFAHDGYQGLYSEAMTMPQNRVDEILQPLLSRIIPLYNDNKLDRSQEDFWAARAALTFQSDKGCDRGIFSIYFFNLLALKRGQAVFQDAGIPHAYLEGQNVEIMANSDNVLRGGLTTKHIDVKELLKHVKCEETRFEILHGDRQTGKEIVYPSTAPDFQLSRFEMEIDSEVSFTASTAEMILVTGGKVLVSTLTESFELKPGAPSGIVFSGTDVQVKALNTSTVFRATVPELLEGGSFKE